MQVATPQTQPSSNSGSSFSRTGDFVRRHKWLWTLLAATTLGTVGWLVGGAVEKSIKSLLADKMSTILEADVAALTTWLDAQKNVADSWAYDPILRVHIDQVLNDIRSKDANASAIVGSDERVNLHEYLFPYMKPLGFEGYIIATPDGLVIASDQEELLGVHDHSAYEEYFSKAVNGTTTVSRPFPSVALIEDATGQSTAGIPTMLAVSVINDDAGHPHAIVALRIRPDKDFETLLRAARAGDTGETYAFDRSGLMLSESRFDEQLKSIGLISDRPGSRAMLQIEIRDPAVNMALGERPQTARGEQPLTLMAESATSGQTGVDAEGYNDYRGVPVIGAWTWLEEYDFGVATELDLEEAYQPVFVLRTAFGVLFSLLCASTVAILVSMFALSRLRRIAARESRKAKKLGQYQLEEKIGEGGMGEVYRARHAMLARPTAVKLLKPEQCNQLALARFEREVQLSSQLTHPNTIQIFDYGRTDEGVFYYAMEYLDGLSLSELIHRHGPMPVGRVLHILSQVCGSLSEAHRIGLIHRDIKPANIMLTCRGGIPDFAKVLDFGLVKNTEAEHAMTVTVANALAGTPLYFSPEATKGAKHLDQRSDIYSLGVVAYEMLTGRPPFVGDSPIDICMQHATKQSPSVAENMQHPLPHGLDAIITQCLSKSPEDRPQTASELRDQLNEVAVDDNTWSNMDAKNWWKSLLDKNNKVKSEEAETVLF